MPGDVLDHHDGVVDQDADREDQREQADAVDRVAHQPGGEQRQQDRRRDHDETTTPSRQPIAKLISSDDRQRRERQVEQQLVGLLVRGLAVVARDRDVEAVGDERRLSPLRAGAGSRRRHARRWRPCAWRGRAHGRQALEAHRRRRAYQMPGARPVSAPTTTSATSLT